MATVSVTDTGHGLPSGTEAVVFDPFYTTKPNGLGMGLSIARSIVEAHGGIDLGRSRRVRRRHRHLHAAARGGRAALTISGP